MPERAKAATRLAEWFMGTQTWDGRTGECASMPTDEYDRVTAAADQAYLSIMDGIDWARVLLEAAGRCAELHHDTSDDKHWTGPMGATRMGFGELSDSTTKGKKMSDKPAHGTVKVWWIPQVPGEPFEVIVPDIATGKLVADILADYDQFQLDQNIKPDYCNTGGVVIYDAAEDEWFDAEEDDFEPFDLV